MDRKIKISICAKDLETVVKSLELGKSENVDNLLQTEIDLELKISDSTNNYKTLVESNKILDWCFIDDVSPEEQKPKDVEKDKTEKLIDKHFTTQEEPKKDKSFLLSLKAQLMRERIDMKDINNIISLTYFSFVICRQKNVKDLTLELLVSIIDTAILNPIAGEIILNQISEQLVREILRALGSCQDPYLDWIERLRRVISDRYNKSIDELFASFIQSMYII
jgi:hypothetical protein